MTRLVYLFALSFIFAQALNSTELDANDLVALNYALTLENLEATYYTTFMNQFLQSDFNDAGFNSTTYSYFLLIKNHEIAHVNALTTTINNAGGTPVTACTYTFPVTNVTEFVQLARILESTGVSAYDGAINTINNLAYRTVAASIAGVEARHASYLNLLLGEVPFPQALDNATAPTVIQDKISPFIVSCPTAIKLPVIATVTSCSTTVVSEPLPTRNVKRATTLTDAQLDQNDIVALNYALTLERLLSNFYTKNLANFTAADFTNAGYADDVFAYMVLIQSHELAHVTTLSEAVTAMGGTPVPACTYVATNYTVPQFISEAQVLTNTAVSAYVGAIDTINDLTLRTVAASITTVESRHAAFLNQLVGDVPFPGVTENATSPSVVVTTISTFIVSCPFTIETPIPALSECYAGVGSDGNTGSTSSTTSDVPNPCLNLVSQCQLACASSGVLSCSCLGGFPDIVCGSGTSLVVSVVLTVGLSLLYILL